MELMQYDNFENKMISLHPINITTTNLKSLETMMFVVPTTQVFSLTNTSDKAVFSLGAKSATPMNPVVFSAPTQSIIQCGDSGEFELNSVSLNIGNASGFYTQGLLAKTFFRIYQNGTLLYQSELATNSGVPFYTELFVGAKFFSGDLICFSLQYSSAPPSYPTIYVDMLSNFQYSPL